MVGLNHFLYTIYCKLCLLRGYENMKPIQKQRSFFFFQFCNHSICNASTYLGTSMLEEPLLWNSILTGSCEKIMSIDVIFSIEIHWCPISTENKYDYRAQKSQLHKCWVKCLGIEVIVTHQYLCGERNQLLLDYSCTCNNALMYCLNGWRTKFEKDCATFFHSYVSHSIKALLYVSNGSRPYTGCWHLTLRIKLKWIYLWNWTSPPWKNTWACTTVFVISQIFGSASHPNGQIAHHLFPLCSHQQ